MQGTDTLVEHFFRHEAGKMVAVLTNLFGIHQLSLAEDAVQEAFIKAHQEWKFGLPPNPSAWLMQVAKNKAVDVLRRTSLFNQYSKKFLAEANAADVSIDHFFLDTEIADSQLRMMFACCHPQLKQEDQVALTLNIVSGFSIKEIAKALSSGEAIIQKRLHRAKTFLQQNNIQLEIPAGKELTKRLETVYTILYLLFNEGYNSLKTDELIRRDLCGEAMRCCKLLSEHKAGNKPETCALLSLMCFHAARFESRLDENDHIILLNKQDRSKWNRELISTGDYYMNLSSAGDILSVYHIESAIAAEHCHAKDFATTNWQRLLALYDLLLSIKPIPVVQLNRAIVLAEKGDINAAIQHILCIDHIEELLTTNYIYSAVLGDLYKRLSDLIKANKYLQTAYNLTPSSAEKQLLKEKMNDMNRHKN